MQSHLIGAKKACGLIGISRPLFGYRSRRLDDAEIKAKLVELAAQKRRYGYRRLHSLLLREGSRINCKRIYRIYREAGLAVRRRKSKRIAAVERNPAVPLPNTSWHGLCSGWFS